MNTKIQDTFLQLVRLGIGHTDTTEFTEKVDWEAVKALAERQGLLAVALDGLDKVPSSAYSMPAMMKKMWIGEVLQNYEYRHELYRRAIAELAGFYNSLGFKMMILKGYACALDWPKPEHRPSGDIDIWLFGEQIAADKALGSWFKAQGSKSEIDNSHHHHTVFYWRDFMVENHYDFINVHARRSNARLEKVFKKLGDVSNVLETCGTSEQARANDNLKPETWNLKQESSFRVTRIPWVEVYGERVYLPSANLHGLFLIRHAVAHFAAAEITLRQVLDWAFFVEKHGSEMDWVWLVKELEEFGLRRFFDVVNAICMEDLGFQPVESLEFRVDSQSESQEFKALKERVLNDILEPEFCEKVPQRLLPRVWFRCRRWQANAWKQRLCYSESRWSAFWTGVWNHLLKPRSI